jgi:hypothetical protein
MHARTHARAHAIFTRTHAHTHARTHAGTHAQPPHTPARALARAHETSAPLHADLPLRLRLSPTSCHAAQCPPTAGIAMRRLRGIVRYRARSPNYKYVGSALLYRYFLIGVVRSCVQRRGRVADANAAERVGQQGRARHVPRLGQRTRRHRHAGRSDRLRARESVVGPTPPSHATPHPTVACGGCGSKVAINKSGTVPQSGVVDLGAF